MSKHHLVTLSSYHISATPTEKNQDKSFESTIYIVAAREDENNSKGGFLG